ncbi:MAG: GEVED domain-containing protein [Bacteroidia bacterium]
MIQRLRITTWIFLLFFCHQGLFAQENTEIPGEFIVMLEKGVSPDVVTSLVWGDNQHPSRLQLVRDIVPRLNIYLFSGDTTSSVQPVLLRQLSAHPGIAIAQYNHRISKRESLTTIPTDPGFVNQWALSNTGQFGGVPDADIDATEAWDLATGGLTVLGDSIVIAVVDGGISLTQEDLFLWKNHGEIPGNGVDDDGNGYIDDFNGWNAFQNNGTIPSDVHGTLVAGVASSRPYNGKGGVGVSWNTAIMPVAASSVSEATVVAGYGYVLEMRTRYNQSNGAEGAFVVVANSSFGVNFGNPANFPIWCAMYDSLGMQGVLSVVSTMNSPQNVDIVGDVPSACISPWMIAVTNTTPTDTKRSDAAFGLTTIDLGAPGTQIYSTLPGNAYGYDTGTSFASPHVAGTLALMASYACPGLMVLYKNDPATAALKFKNFLLNSVDTLSSLQGLVATGGRLNAFHALLMLDDSCSTFSNGCLPPYNLAATILSDTTARLFWQHTDSADSFILRYRLSGDTLWTGPFTLTDTFFTLAGLSACTAYEYQVAAACDTLFSGYFDTEAIVTEGCCESPDAPVVSEVADTSALFSWHPVFGSDYYLFQIREVNDPFGPQIQLTDTFLLLSALLPCTEYEVRVKALCDTTDNGYSEITHFRTTGCGACLDLDYCLSQGNDVSFEWIQEVSAGPLLYTSGKNDGYGAFTDYSWQLVKDSVYNLLLTPGYAGFAFSESWRVWIDFNQDGVFNDTTERVFGTTTAQSGQIAAQIHIPPNALTGPTRMRVSMRFGGFSGNQVPHPCESFNEGEVEDYCITLTDQVQPVCDPPPAPEFDWVGDTLHLTWTGNADFYQVRLKKTAGGATNLFQTTVTFFSLYLPPNCEAYELQVQGICGFEASAFSPVVKLFSKGCGDCRDLSYCAVSGPAQSSSWIRKVRIGDVLHNSGMDSGYGDYTQTEIILKRGDSVLVELVPAFSGSMAAQWWALWADWNHDGDFEDQYESVVTSTAPADSFSGKIAVPAGVDFGTVRLRAGMRADSLPQACGSFAAGEWQDYCAVISPGTAIAPDILLPRINLYPNPTAGQVTIRSDRAFTGYSVYNLMGMLVLNRSFFPTITAQADLSGFPPGIYRFVVFTDRSTVSGSVVRQ